VHLIILDWVGDLESETGGRIGLWKMCEKNELSDVCVGKLEDMMDLPSMSFQVSNKLLRNSQSIFHSFQTLQIQI
jgi:hypothetical protein